MGACCSCLPRIFSQDGTRGASADSDGSLRWRRRCCRLISCCGMCDALFERQEEQDATSGPLLQPTQESSDAVSYVHSSHSDIRHAAAISSSVRQEKVGARLLQTQIGETHYRSSSGSGHCAEALVIQQGKVIEQDTDRKLDMSKVPPPSKNGKSESITSLLDDEDICPTCLDGYDTENPKIITKCGHHFHLACILEWMERSSHCPLCDQEMVFSESP